MCKKEFTTKNGELVTIKINDDGTQISVWSGDRQLGTIDLNCFDDPDYYFYITHLALDHCKGLGIGRACLEFHKAIFSSPIWAAADDGIQRDDGSHLTGDGPGFIAKMVAEGLVRQPSEGYDD